jgi:electron transport complex protein RnfC
VLKTFPKGGIHPPDNKITARIGIESLTLPDMVTIPVLQHSGVPAQPVVDKGDKVLAGQLIAKSNGSISANIHSSVSGTVSKIDNIPDCSGYKQLSIVIEVAGDEWISTIDRKPDIIKNIDLTGEQIIKKCFESGIVGLGGATFPTHVKLKIPANKKCEVLIINGVECEPYLTADHRLMLEKGEEMLTGIRIIMKALNTGRAMIGIENNKPDAIDHLRKLCNGSNEITVHPLKVKYPQGGEKQLIRSLINKEVPLTGLPIDIGVIVQNVGTAFAVYEAIQKNKPLFERVITVTGPHLKKPGNFLVRIGTPVNKLIEAAGGIPQDTGKIINGGPMMGKALYNTAVPVVKGTSGIIILPEGESNRKDFGPCIKCGKCIIACALNFEPYLLMTLIEKGLFDRAEKEKITSCMECGSCSYVCPAHRPILDYIRLGKSNVNKMIHERKTL